MIALGAAGGGVLGLWWLTARSKPSASASASVTDSGVNGLVMYGPTCPVEILGASCWADVSTVVHVTNPQTDRVVATTTSDAHGQFSVALPPGTYVVSAAEGAGAVAEAVTVIAHQFTATSLRIPSGIR